MLTCIACSKQLSSTVDRETDNHDKQSIKTLTSQIKDMALKASGAYRCTKPYVHDFQNPRSESGPGAEKCQCSNSNSSYGRSVSSNSTMTRRWGKEMEARLKGISSTGNGGGSSGEGTPSPSSLSHHHRVGSMSHRVVASSSSNSIVFMEEDEPKEWVAQVEPGVLITFVSMPQGGNDLKRIRFSREMFNRWQASRWWAENHDKVMELYNVQRLNRQAFPLPTPPRSEDESSKMESMGDSPMTPPLNQERLPRNLQVPMGMGYSSSDSLDHHPMRSRQYYEPGPASTPKLSNLSGTKTETTTSSMDASTMRTSSSREADRSGELSLSNASDLETEWVEQDEPGVYITIRAVPGGTRELRRVRFSREKFGEMHARVWWEENRSRIREQYL
ncbi:hypothetical protein MKW94_019624 [Papaver nudicaule]|uniref:BRX domain-containing protein n=1 Tax=Papaver nudicaule TaxID=74823 RepID=A0AA42AQU6_PAPNU|nr:hypothetical protein [Papaver nudicaule]